jgi:hypothetical protein
MRLSRGVLISLVLAATATPAPAGVFFWKKAKPNPAERVPALVGAVKSDPAERKRAAAAQELRDYDPAAFPEIVPVLIDVAQHDTSAGVRVEALQSLARLRPVSQQAGMVLEEAAEHDGSLRVRLQARSALVQYRLSGYRSPAKEETQPASGGVKTEEPPLASPAAEPPLASPTAEPPAAKPPAPAPTSGRLFSFRRKATPVASPPPAVPTAPAAAPTAPAVAPTAPAAPPTAPPPPTQGPDLVPPE